ncbi:MAG: hypothetical protein GEU90_02855 [Gemmatimonas sp.]|nr:hypothetical protein [Gemmatimonas sp.]
MIRPEDYVEFVRREYLGEFVRSGGATVKFVLPQDGLSIANVGEGLRRAAEQEGFVYARVDAAAVKVHMIDKVFNAIARQVDWNALAWHVVRETLGELRFDIPSGESRPTLEEIACANDYDPAELRREFNRRLQTKLFRDYQMAQEFRIAMIRLCQAQVDASAAAQTTAIAITDWLTGDLKRIVALKPALIFQRIGRHNARHMLFSLAWWLTRAGRAGLVLELDVRRCLLARRADVPPDSVHYSKPATLDAYEVLRQLIDATDELSYCFTLVSCAPEFLTDPARGVDAYLALKLRIWDDVHDARRANPLSALVRLTANAPPLEERA